MEIKQIRHLIKITIEELLHRVVQDDIVLYEELESINLLELQNRVAEELEINLDLFDGPLIKDLENMDSLSNYFFSCVVKKL